MRLVHFTIAAAALIAVPSGALAADFTWVSAGTANWNNTTTAWSPSGSIPGAGDNIAGNTSTSNLLVNGSFAINNWIHSANNWNVLSGTTNALLTVGGALTNSGAVLTLRDSGANTLGLTINSLNVSGGSVRLGLNTEFITAFTATTATIGNGTLSIYQVAGGTARINNLSLTNAAAVVNIRSNSNATTATGSSSLLVNSLVGTTGTIQVVASATSAVSGSLLIQSTGSSNYSGVIADRSSGSFGVLNVVKSGAGTQVLGGSNTFSGGAIVSAGSLLINNTAGSGAGTGSVIVNGGTVGGTGGFTGALTVNSGGSLEPGASVETLGSGVLTMNDGSTFGYEVDSSVALSVGADLQKVTGDLNLNGTVTLTLDDIATLPVAFSLGTTFSVINYTGTWDGGLFTYNGNVIANGGTFTAGLNTWQLDYDAITGGSNFSGEYAGGNFVNITSVVPEPGSLGLFGLGMTALWWRSRSRRRGLVG